MNKFRELTVISNKDGDMIVSLCPELDIASQGKTEEIAVANLREAIELFLEYASKSEIVKRLSGHRSVSKLTVELPI